MGWATSDGNGGYLRPHTPENHIQHRAFLDQLNEGSAAYFSAIDWFQTLPVYLDLDGLRMVHACWHQPSLDLLRHHLSASCRRTGKDQISRPRRILFSRDQRLPCRHRIPSLTRMVASERKRVSNGGRWVAARLLIKFPIKANKFEPAFFGAKANKLDRNYFRSGAPGAEPKFCETLRTAFGQR